MNYDERNIEQHVDFTCKSCAYFKERTLYEGGPCSQLGGKDADKPCDRFTINPHKWTNSKRVRILQALAALRSVDVSVSDVRALLYSADRLPAKYAYGTRWWLPINTGKGHMRICATVIGKMAGSGKLTLFADNGAILVISALELEAYETEDAPLALATFDVELPSAIKRKHQAAPEDHPAETASGAKIYTLRGGDEPESDLDFLSGKESAPSKPQDKAKVKAKGHAKHVSPTRRNFKGVVKKR